GRPRSSLPVSLRELSRSDRRSMKFFITAEKEYQYTGVAKIVIGEVIIFSTIAMNSSSASLVISIAGDAHGVQVDDFAIEAVDQPHQQRSGMPIAARAAEDGQS